MIRDIVFEFFVYFERLFLKRNLEFRSGPYTFLYFNGFSPDLVILISKFKSSSGGTRTIFKLLHSYISNSKPFLVLFDSKLTQDHIRNILNDLNGSPYVKYGTSLEQISASKFLFTNWQSYYSYQNFFGNGKFEFFMLVQDMEFQFFPAGTISAYVRRAFIDSRIKYIALGEWVEGELVSCGIDCQKINFPITISDSKIDFKALNHKKSQLVSSDSEIHILVYIKHSFRRAGGLLLSQLNSVPSVINGRNINIQVIGYTPFLFKFRFKRHIKFLGHVSEDEISSMLSQATFGITYSMTNISLLPFQMVKYSVIPIDLVSGTSKKTAIGDYVIAIEPSDTSLREFLELSLNKYAFGQWFATASALNIESHSLENCSLEMLKIIEKTC